MLGRIAGSRKRRESSAGSRLLAMCIAVFVSLLPLGFGAPASASSVETSVGSNPFGVAVNPSTNMVYVTNNRDSTVSVINGNTNKVTAVIQVGGAPFGVAVNPNTNTIYVTNNSDGTVSVINGNSNTVTATVPVGLSARGIAVNPNTNTVYVDGTGIYSDVYGHRVLVINGITNVVAASIPVKSSPFGVAVNPNTNTVYVTNPFSNCISVISGETNTVKTTVPVGRDPRGVAVNANTNTVYVTSVGPLESPTGNVAVIDGATNAVTATIPVGRTPRSVAIKPRVNAIYVVNTEDKTLSIINGDTNTVVATVNAGSSPRDIAINPSIYYPVSTVYVTNSNATTVALLDDSALGLPSAPIVTSSSSGNGSISIGWSAPNPGFSALTSYSLSASPAVGPTLTLTVPASQLSATITGLADSTQYLVTVAASSLLGMGATSLPLSLTTATVTPPEAPSITAISTGNGSISLNWSTPLTGNSPILFYVIGLDNVSGTFNRVVLGDATTVKIDGLTNGATYSVSMYAVNTRGIGQKTVPVSLTLSIDTYSFVGGGGSGTSPASGFGRDGTSFTLPSNTFTRLGYAFAGWSDGSKTLAAGATYALASSGAPVIFTAQWAAFSIPINVATTSPVAVRGKTFTPVTYAVSNASPSTAPYSTTFKWSARGLPKGITLNATTGVLSGKVSSTIKPGKYSASVSVIETVTTLNGTKKATTQITATTNVTVTVS